MYILVPRLPRQLTQCFSYYFLATFAFAQCSQWETDMANQITGISESTGLTLTLQLYKALVHT